MNRADIAVLISQRLTQEQNRLRSMFSAKRYFVLDDLLPVDTAEAIYRSFPDHRTLMLRKSIRELKYVTSQMDKYNRLLEEAVFCFQDDRVIDAIHRITGLRAIEPDEKLYAGGISLMSEGHFLHPHIDNSHDLERQRYRILNLLYYTSPDWDESCGGNFEYWPNGVTGDPETIVSRFNRLLCIATDTKSWHSVNKVRVPRSRTCVSNYYFSKLSPEPKDYFHVTSFRGRPENPLTDLLLRSDAAARGFVRKVFARGLVKTKHVYTKT